MITALYRPRPLNVVRLLTGVWRCVFCVARKTVANGKSDVWEGWQATAGHRVGHEFRWKDGTHGSRLGETTHGLADEEENSDRKRAETWIRLNRNISFWCLKSLLLTYIRYTNFNGRLFCFEYTLYMYLLYRTNCVSPACIRYDCMAYYRSHRIASHCFILKHCLQQTTDYTAI